MYGAEPLHPKRLRVPKSVSRTTSVFAVDTTPGPERQVGFTPTERLSHLGVLSPTGSGKSESVLAPLLLSDVAAGRPVVLPDPKAQLVDFVLDRLPEEASERIVLFDPSHPDGTAGFNPLDIGDRDPYVVVDGIVAVLRAVFSDAWGPRTEDILNAALLTLALDGGTRENPHTLLDVPRLLTEPAFRRSVVGSVSGEAVLATFWQPSTT
ncbi:type IV secretory system conjugative DNA transfer family protein [Microbacterium proteolyticum]|uniref:type IV secretory system conjugative DNA transfer family protein n=1 Tax=Microbacterium proteolyticum TaxID=1572644 RepID=UPI0027E2ED90|nr:type IV secretory system conjugative DNA transfer family protein [Microbacterium proteolyticum]MCI9857225.1 type IV secretory system conjugative DNA transfer family protein [Microbacterium proteolyticum]